MILLVPRRRGCKVVKITKPGSWLETWCFEEGFVVFGHWEKLAERTLPRVLGSSLTESRLV